uniref:Ubiquitin-activating enzyme E1 n=1 Tax=Gouania willdenowi TaxID=441366 RepID=A0A8C5EE76_GOUWI
NNNMSGAVGIDEGFYSRQLYVLGHEAMGRMSTANVLVAGMRGLGVEIAKDVILSGVRSVTVQDDQHTQWTDLSSQFFLKECHLGQNRALCSLQQLTALNPHVQVLAYTQPLDTDFLLQFQVVVLTNSSLDDQKRFGELCHSRGIQFIVADTKGLCGQLFCDFGECFEVLDSDGVTPASVMIQHISKVLVSCYTGIYDLIQTCCPYSFSINDTSSFSDYIRGGVATEVKQPVMFEFKPLREALQDHSLLVMNDWGKERRHKTLHLAFQALHGFVKTQQRLPQCWCQSDADSLLAAVRELNKVAQLEQLDEAVVRSLSYTARGDLAPVNAFIGSVAAQEVIKACSGKFTPLQQWMYFDALECLPEDKDQAAPSSFLPKSSRYDGQIAVFGSDFQEKLMMQNYFVVGAGAIGCELLKNFALVGLGAGEDGKITVTDMDFIEKSNLNRQFLFRSQDIGKSKSEVAAVAVREMNPQMNVVAHQNRLDTNSEEVYNYNFFKGLHGVAAALDNVEARVYLDGLCIKYQKSMLEGGTLGSKGHTLVVVPHLTASYGPVKSNSSGDIPLCTLKNFPHRIEHTLQWARDQFEGLFKHVPENVNHDAEFVERTLTHGDAEALETLEGVWRSQVNMEAGGTRPQSWEDCVSWARHKWETLFNNDIRQLLHCFPEGEVTSTGLPFWSGSKRCPHPLDFDPNIATHLDYVVAASNLYGQIYNIKGRRDRNSIKKILEGVHVPIFTPNSSQRCRSVNLWLCLFSVIPFSSPLLFLNDDDSNFHMDYIVAASNLRAENYYIPAADRHQSKRIAGRIIPAIATTTAAVAGLMCLELYKLVQGHQNISSYRSAFINLAVQYFVLSQPCPPPHFEVSLPHQTSQSEPVRV